MAVGTVYFVQKGHPRCECCECCEWRYMVVEMVYLVQKGQPMLRMLQIEIHSGGDSVVRLKRSAHAMNTANRGTRW